MLTRGIRSTQWLGIRSSERENPQQSTVKEHVRARRFSLRKINRKEKRKILTDQGPLADQDPLTYRGSLTDQGPLTDFRYIVTITFCLQMCVLANSVKGVRLATGGRLPPLPPPPCGAGPGWRWKNNKTSMISGILTSVRGLDRKYWVDLSINA